MELNKNITVYWYIRSVDLGTFKGTHHYTLCLHFVQVLKRYLQIFSEKLLDSEGRKSVLSSFLSIHVTYHINELQIVQYRELGSIFEELHQLVLDGLSADVDEVSEVYHAIRSTLASGIWNHVEIYMYHILSKHSAHLVHAIFCHLLVLEWEWHMSFSLMSI